VSVKVYVEGGGDSKADRIRCSEAFSKLIAKAGFRGRMPGVVACGGRGRAYDRFRTAMTTAKPDDFPMLLVDSEEPVAANRTAWQHLARRDGWQRPDGADDDQAQLMVTCMETWIVAGLSGLTATFGQGLRVRGLPRLNLERRAKDDIQERLVIATVNCAGPYVKGKRSFQALAAVDPTALEDRLPHFKRFVKTLNQRLAPPSGRYST